ncbi:MAG: EAL domain-containing protein [Proteobacteria bacterium]|nr:MAG: EAL domain-containing protein [Pseudomonadota bacterium]QKK11196.1 MAG: EAL domain-containing protein [Pseudomonadota bacterium]
MPPGSGQKRQPPISLIGFRTLAIAAVAGAAISGAAFLAIHTLQTANTEQSYRSENQRLLRLAGNQLTAAFEHHFVLLQALASHFQQLPEPKDKGFENLAHRALSATPGLAALLWIRPDESSRSRLHRALPLEIAAQLSGVIGPSAGFPTPRTQPVIINLPMPLHPNQDWVIAIPAGKTGAESIAALLDVDHLIDTTLKLLDSPKLKLRLLLPANGEGSTRILHPISAQPTERLLTTRLDVGGRTLQLDLFPPSVTDAALHFDRSAWLALGGGALLTLLGLSYLAVLQRKAAQFARLQLTQGKRLAQLARQEMEQDLRLKSKAIEASHNAIVITDATRARQPIIYVNKACERITGYTRSELLGRSPDILLAHEKNQPAMIKLRTAIKRGEGGSAAVRCYRKDGSMFWNELSISPVHDPSGRIAQHLAVMSDVTDRKRFADQLLHQATHDQLTGLPNRNLMQDRLAQAIAHAQRYQGFCGLLLLNVDRLKAINESLGHRIGNQVLKATAERIAHCARNFDTVARLSGDEFVVILPELHEPDEMLIVAKRILESFLQTVHVEGHELKITCSIGGSAFPKDSDDAEALLRNADIAMGRAKQKGKNRFEFFTQEMNANAAERLRMETELRHAVENGELLLHYQPRVDLTHGRVVGVEALVRWQHPERGMVPPAVFIPVAEDAGLIPHIGDWVLHAACRQLRQWQDDGLPSIAMAVNISALQLQRPELPQEIGDVLRSCQIDPRNLELELTESVVMENAAEAITALQRLKEIGLNLAMDDFGTGYSSLAYLRRFPFDYLKIDRSFIANLTRDPDEASIARTIIAMAHSLRLKVIAEGVETEAQARYLQHHHCDELQGFLFSKPITADEAAELLRLGRTLFDTMPVHRSNKRTVLIVDDQIEALNALRRVLRREGYRILTTPSALEGLELLATEGAEVVISDQRMPEMSGVEFLSKVRELHPETIRIELTGSTDIQAAAELINRGAIFRFLTKPCDDEDLRRNVREAFNQYEDAKRLREARDKT